MSLWQRRLRLVIALGGVALVVVVAFAFQRRVDVPSMSVTRADPKAVVETSKGTRIRVNRDREEVRVESDELRVYADGSATMFGVKATTERAGGRTFTISARQGQVDKNESNYIFEGDVRLESSDGLSLQTERATYRESDGIVRSDGATKFSRGRTSGSGYGFTYDKNRDVLRFQDDVVVNIAPLAEGGGPMTITTQTIEVDRQQHVMRFETPFKATRGREIIEADTGVGRLTADNDRLQMLELRGRSRITAAPGKVGSLQSMSGRDIDLEYGPDGETVEDAVINGDAVIRMAGEPAPRSGRARSSAAEDRGGPHDQRRHPRIEG
jgi:LPS export ABC transporter protein LptC